MLKEFISNMIDSFNPNSYSFLSNRDFRSSSRHFLMIVLIFSMINFLFFLPQIISFYSEFNENINKIDTINATFNVKTNDALVIADKPLIIMDSTRNSTNKEFLLITDDTIYKKGLFGYSTYSLKGFDFANFIKSSKIKIVMLMILSLPTIFLFYFMFNLVKTLLLVLFTSFLIYSVLRIRDRPITWKQVANMSVYSLSILLAFKLILWFNMMVKFWIPLVLYFIWVIIIVFLLDDARIAFVPDPAANKLSPREVKRKRYADVDADTIEMSKINDLVKHSKRR